jgi:L-alanine-DL-glutamate epimerase-like enolase superfamily enzyme
LSWVEEPVFPDDIRGYAQVREAVNTRISGGEHEFTRYGFRELTERQAVDIVQVDVNCCGGITEARKIWALAAAYGLPVIPHAGQMHNYHLIISHMTRPSRDIFHRQRAACLQTPMRFSGESS